MIAFGQGGFVNRVCEEAWWRDGEKMPIIGLSSDWLKAYAIVEDLRFRYLLLREWRERREVARRIS